MTPAPQIRHMGPRDSALIGIVALGFGGSFLFIDIVVDQVPPFTLTCLRSLVAFLALACVVRVSGVRLPSSGRLWLQLGLLGLTTQVIPMVLLSWGQTRIPSGLAGIILGSVPVVTMLLAHVFVHDERITPRALLGTMIGFGGVIVVIGPSALGGLDANLLAELAVLAGCVSIASANILARRAAHFPPAVMACGAQATALVMLAPLSLVIDRPWTLAPDGLAIVSIVMLGVVGSAMPGLLFYHVLKRVGATRASLAAYLVPLVAVVLGALVLDERLAWTAFAGMVLILGGAVLVNRRTRSP